jgi:hypothetical protein
MTTEETVDKRATRWEVIGIFLIITFGTTLHFWFAWTNYWRPMALIAAVNESTWEHFKMAFWPGLFLAIVEYVVWGRTHRGFIPAKFLGLLAMPLITMALFYGYTAFWHHNLPADIAVFVLSVAGGQLLSLWILRKGFNWPSWLRGLCAAGLILMIAAFSTQSYFPRRNFIFAHPGTGEYGILDDYSEHDHGNDGHDSSEE